MNIVHIAWLSGHNYGDDLMAKAIWNKLAEQYPDTKITVWCHNRPTSHEGVDWIYKGLPRIGLFRRMREKSALKNADMLLLGGGTILHSANSILWKLAAVRAFKALHPNKPAFGIGLSLGPFANKQDEEICKELLKLLDGCALRDDASYQLAKNSGLPYEPINAADLAGVFVKDTGLTRKPLPAQIANVGFVVAVPSVKYRDRSFGVYGDILRGVVSRYRSVTLLLAAHPEGREDLIFAKQLIERCGLKGKVKIVEYADDPISFTQVLYEQDHIITSRLHGMVIGYFLGIPVTMISYLRKFEDFADSVGIPAEHRFKESDVTAQVLLQSICNYAYQGAEAAFERSFRNFDIFTNK